MPSSLRLPLQPEGPPFSSSKRQPSGSPPRPTAFPTVSVIIPTYNRASLLAETLASVFQQTCPAHEIIVVDDGSTDDTADVLERIRIAHQNSPARFRLLHQPNRGKSIALNNGLSHARGEWIAYDDSDDLWLPTKLERQFEAITRFPQCGACFTDSRYVNNPEMDYTAFSRLDDRYPGKIGVIETPLEGVCRPPHGIYMQSILVRHDVMKRIGDFDPQFRVAQDTDFIFRLARETPFCYVNEALVYVDRSESRVVGLTTEFKRHSLDRIREDEALFEKWLTLLPPTEHPIRRQLRGLLRNVRAKSGIFHLRNRDFGTARTHLRDALKTRFSLLVLAKFLLVQLSPRLAFYAATHSPRLRSRHRPC